jgi:hypothetical protein
VATAWAAAKFENYLDGFLYCDPLLK